MVDEAAVDRAARELAEAGVGATEPRYYPEYDCDYYARFFENPDGVRLEVTNFRERRRRLIRLGGQRRPLNNRLGRRAKRYANET